MDITINSQVLAQELALLAKIVLAKPVLPILSNVLIHADGHLWMQTTDLEIAMSSVCRATIDQPGTITLPAARLLGLAQQFPDAPVRITLENRQVHVACGKFNSRLQTLPADDFPAIPSVEGHQFPITATALKTLLDCTRYATAEKKDVRQILDGALFTLSGKAASCVATDGKRLSFVKVAQTDGPEVSVILPSKIVDVLMAQDFEGTVVFSTNEKHLFFIMGDRLILSKMIDGKFPSYDKIIPRDNDKQATINRAEFAAALRRVGQVSSSDKATVFDLSPGQLLITSTSAEIGEAIEQLGITYTGQDIKFCTNWRYVLDFLEAASGQTVEFALKSPLHPLLLSDGGDFLNVVLGMRM